MENPCTCLDLCTCLAGCCKQNCDSHSCEHEIYECICDILCKFCTIEELEEKLFKNKIETSNNKRKIEEDDEDDTNNSLNTSSNYDAYDSDSEEPINPSVKLPVKKLRFTIYTL